MSLPSLGGMIHGLANTEVAPGTAIATLEDLALVSRHKSPPEGGLPPGPRDELSKYPSCVMAFAQAARKELKQLPCH